MVDQISPVINRTLDEMDARLHRSVNQDMTRRLLRVYRREAALYYIDGMVSGDFLQHYILTPCMAHADDHCPGDIMHRLMNDIPVGDAKEETTYLKAVEALMMGKAVLFVDGAPSAACLDVRFLVRRGVSPPLTERVVCGPHQGFNETLRDNVTLIRRMLRTPDLVGQMLAVGDNMPTSVCMMYVAGIADEENLHRVENRLKALRVDHVLSIGEVQQLLEDRPHALVPQCLLTERPDRAVSCLMEGQVVLVMDGSSQVLCAPVSIFHLLHTPDDTAMRWQYGTFLRLLRLFGALCALLLPGLFVAAVTFHPEALPVTLLTAVLESQAAVPLSIPAETILMLLMFNLMNEAGTRVPGVTGNTLGTVSGLILGQAAVEARLIHPLLIIVVAVASLGSYAIPDYALGLAVRIGQMMFVAAACIFGLYGMVLLMAAGTVRLCGVRSFGSPMAAPVAPLRPHNPDVLIRGPLWRQRLHTWLGNPHHMARSFGPMRRWDRK